MIEWEEGVKEVSNFRDFIYQWSHNPWLHNMGNLKPPFPLVSGNKDLKLEPLNAQ